MASLGHNELKLRVLHSHHWLLRVQEINLSVFVSFSLLYMLRLVTWPLTWRSGQCVSWVRSCGDMLVGDPGAAGCVETHPSVQGEAGLIYRSIMEGWHRVLYWILTMVRLHGAGIILRIRPVDERRSYNVTSLIGWAHTQNDLWWRNACLLDAGVITHRGQNGCHLQTTISNAKFLQWKSFNFDKNFIEMCS